MENDQTQVTINNTTKVLHFSDGVDEEIEESQTDCLNTTTYPIQDDTDTTKLSWGPWFAYYAWRSGTKMLNAVDYAGEGLASFFGITTPKYQLEISEYERLQAEKKKIDEDSVGWVPKNEGGNIPLVLNEPKKNYSPTNV